MKPIIATRRLKYSNKKDKQLMDIEVKVSAPFQVPESEKQFDSEHLCYCCIVYFINGHGQISKEKVYGADEVQAVHLASNIDGYIKIMSKSLDIYWLDGEPYFCD